MKVTAIVWGSELPMLTAAARKSGVSLTAWATFRLKDPEMLQSAIESLPESDVIILHPTADAYWDTLIPRLRGRAPVISFGHDQSFWELSTVALQVTATVNAYFTCGGPENMDNLFSYLRSQVLGETTGFTPPQAGRWEGVYHPDAPGIFESTAEYLRWRGTPHADTVGILFYRIYWANGDLGAIDALIREFERHANVIPVFTTGTGDEQAGALPATEVIRTYLSGHIDALVCLPSSALAPDAGAPEELFQEMNVPVFHPLVLYYRTEEEWLGSSDGIASSELGWSVVLPEMYGMTGMIPVACAMQEGPEGPENAWHQPITERVAALSRRVMAWIRLRKKPNSEKKVAIILNSSPCASVEANVGAAAHLDAMESVVRILSRLRDHGYSVEVPESGDALAREILEKRAVNEFRWTTVEDIIRRGGALGFVDGPTCRRWFEELDPGLQESIAAAWGAPPGEERNGVPPAMVYGGSIVVTGLSFGNAVICTQPKRGCAGSRCDGQVCRILHDPFLPPPHHYLAAYRYLERVFCADVIIHVGTHGTLEFLPGKSAALSGACVPDAVTGPIPYLYIYNSDNPSEGTIAKRRASAVIVDHMQTVMAPTGTYGALKELEDRISEYDKFRDADRAKAHALEHQIIDLVKRAGLERDVGYGPATAFDDLLEGIHRVISGIYTTHIPDGMHIFGTVPEGERRARFIATTLNHDGSVHALLTGLMGLDIAVSDSETALVRLLNRFAEGLVGLILAGTGPAEAASQVLGDRFVSGKTKSLEAFTERVRDLAGRMAASDEIGSLENGMAGGYIPPGPSGLISRGKTDILPTGRNFYSLDPRAVPTAAAWTVGRRLADLTIEKYRDDQGTYPENVAILWMASDIMWADGEQFAQILALIGVEPVWVHGRLKSFRVIPPEALGRPRIDVTVRISGILRDCFYQCVELLDDALKTVASLDEPEAVNFLKKHAGPAAETPRIFGAPKGTYGMGVNLAVYASAWEATEDLADVFIYWNGFAYGRGRFGDEERAGFVARLETVDLTFNKTATDEYDLLGCCCYFGSHGGLTAAARSVSGKKVEAYYGDTRNVSNAEVRTLAEEIRRVVRTKLLNPQWIDGLKAHGYAGASEIARRTGRVYGWDATTGEVDDWIFDEIARTFFLDEQNREFFREHNVWAMEEMGRRLLEAHARGLWQADEEAINGLREVYLAIEGDLEEEMGEVTGRLQGGAIDVVTSEEIRGWRAAMEQSGVHIRKKT
ncbi:MAG: cobaltochelatase subunit CobN [Methanomicrobiaceae archaeon]|nr:cobaltochelatase subunit CobN [Methanomicrobiaceae archaeon]